MTVKTVLVLLLVFSGISSYSQSGKFIIKPNWEQGEKKTLTVTGEQFWNMHGSEDKSPMPVKKYQIEVLENIENGYLIQWKIMSDENLSLEEDFMQDYINNFYYEFILDSNGVFVDLNNWKEIIILNNNFKDTLVSMAKLEDISEAEIDEQFAQMDLPSTKDEISEWFQSMTDMYLAIYGEEFTLFTKNESPTKIPNRILKDGIPATEIIETKKLSDTLISIKYSTVYDYELLKKLFKENYPNQEYQEVKMDASTEYIYNSKTGWVTQVKIVSVSGTEYEMTGFNLNYEIK